MKIKSLALLFVLCSFFIGCATFPSNQISFDLSNNTIPVMLNTQKTEVKTKTFSLISAYTKNVISIAGNKNQPNATIANDNNEGEPLNKQLNKLFIQDPKWMMADKIDLSVSRNFIFIVGSIDKIRYQTALDIKTPIGEEK
ncbi:MAG: hypothetical protein WCT14_00145 [Treponemataceae bacterium]